MMGRTSPRPISPSSLLDVMSEELAYSMQGLVSVDELRPYHMAYVITDEATVTVAARLGALIADSENRR